MSPPSPQRAIVVAVDLTEMTDVVVTTAAAYAAGANATVHAICVIDPGHNPVAEQGRLDGELEQLEQAVTRRIGRALTEAGVASEVHAHRGRPATEIVNLAKKTNAELIVLGRHSQTPVHPGFIGSVPMRIIGTAHCNVLVVQPPDWADAVSLRAPASH